MNLNKQRIAIAEACGWKFETGEKYIGGTSICVTSPTGKSANGYVGKAYRSNDSISGWDGKDGIYFEIEDIFKHPNHVFGPVPNYLNDLNAMHEAEKHLVDNHTSRDFQIARYISHLENIVSYNVRDVGWSFSLTTATAAQKAEAFLKTIGKWEDGK